MNNTKKKNVFAKLGPAMKEGFRKFIVKLKKSPNLIPTAMLTISFLVFSLNLTEIAETTSKMQGKGMGLCEFTSMLLSILSFVCMLNAFPKRQKPNYPMIALMYVMFAIIIVVDVIYQVRIAEKLNDPNSPFKLTKYIYTAQVAGIAHIICVALTAVTVALEPVFAKLLKKINTSVVLEDTISVENIDLADEE